MDRSKWTVVCADAARKQSSRPRHDRRLGAGNRSDHVADEAEQACRNFEIRKETGRAHAVRTWTLTALVFRVRPDPHAVERAVHEGQRYQEENRCEHMRESVALSRGELDS